MVKFLHAADIHLDSPLYGLDSYENAPVDAIRGATRKALAKLVRLAIDQRVTFVLLAGDNYDGDWKDYNTGLFFINQMHELRKAQIPVVMLTGNHDAESRITSKLSLPENVKLLPNDHPGTIVLDRHRVAIHGQGFANQAEFRNLTANYPQPKSGYFNIGMLHTSLDGREGHASYAPCTVEELKARGYDYWALGHVHTRESVNGEEHPRIEFPGNIQGRQIRETGAKGCLIVEVDGNGRTTKQFHSLDVFRWERITLDASKHERLADVKAAADGAIADAFGLAEGRPLAVRVEITVRPELHAELSRKPVEFRMDLAASAGRDVWIEKIKLTQAAASETPSFALEYDARTELFEALAALRSDSEADPFADGDLGKLRNLLPSEIREEFDKQQEEIWERAAALLRAAGGAAS